MFTGLISAKGNLSVIGDAPSQMTDALIEIADLKANWLDDVLVGDSIAVDGVCLTVTKKSEHSFQALVSPETQNKTLLANSKTSGVVNLEKAMRLHDRLGGHLVSGHVDTVVPIIAVETVTDCYTLQFALPQAGAHLVAAKGSVTINGVSLTVNDVNDDSFSVMIIPHTWAETNLSNLKAGDCVHIEYDMLARYVARLLGTQTNKTHQKSETEWKALLQKL